MRTFETTSESEYTDEEQYDMFLDRLFYRIKHQKTEVINIDDFKNIISRMNVQLHAKQFWIPILTIYL